MEATLFTPTTLLGVSLCLVPLWIPNMDPLMILLLCVSGSLLALNMTLHEDAENHVEQKKEETGLQAPLLLAS